ncbi:hypothetical protein [Flavobacterium piscinae]|uniref:hypothetical protein n=1 Tax=Flavobacterium piscinae TaxID=2506424 RepID=UPI002AAC2650|nr:hypothetical protein [Flavobacterium piscinae]
MPIDWAFLTNDLKSSIVPNSGCVDLCPPCLEPIPQGDPTSPFSAVVALFFLCDLFRQSDELAGNTTYQNPFRLLSATIVRNL